ncbi:uncharacterized protein LOC143318897 [Chaetodon auriga]|uniref:uncharacterized protein LOC143318897 n=1 Tax=Chaetodon auriga TaxID=39042 RepID=UPI004032C9AE
MKLGLLVVLAVAAVVPSLSEGRIVSRCELREKLGQAIALPKRLQKHKETVLARVICVVEERSHLNTSLVRVFGKPKTTAAPATTEPTDIEVEDGKVRKRREADDSSEEVDGMEMDSILEELEEDQSDEEDMDEDGNMEGNDDGDEMGEDEQEPEEGGKRKKRSMHHRRHGRRPKAHTLYGLFQLPDRHCDSPSHLSKNTCETTCGAFTDDDIEDDLGCFVKTEHWSHILRRARCQCREIKDFFDECN